MKTLAALCGVLLLVISVAAAREHPKAAHARLVAHGKYLVERVGMCSDCHSPRDEKGQLIRSRYLEGSVLDFKPMHPVPGWTLAAPPIAGLPGWTRAEGVRFFMTGVDNNGKYASPPMPSFRLSRHDAEAVVAYLKSLGVARQ